MNATSSRVTVRAVITGRVQGVWFRGWTCEVAISLGLTGWVRNRRDGTVEAVFSGMPDAVETMLAKCADGPPLATVSDIYQEPINDPRLPDFTSQPSV